MYRRMQFVVLTLFFAINGAYLVHGGFLRSTSDTTAPPSEVPLNESYAAEASYYQLELWPNNGTLPPAASRGRPGSATSTYNCNQVGAVPGHLRRRDHMYPHGLGSFYQKYLHAYGIPVIGSNRLSDSALRRACYVVRFLFADRPELRQSYYKMYGRFALMATTEVTTNIPEHTSLGPWWNTRARGLGATRDRPVSTAGEENALCLTNDKYRVEDIVLHEFSHGLHLLGASYALNGFDYRVRSLYNAARAAGRWANTYAMSTDHEYFAEGVQSYFNANAYSNPPNGIHNHVNTREKLAAYDPGLYRLVREIFPCGNTYISRCDKDRNAEARQRLKMNCDEDGNDGTDDGGEEETCEDEEDRCASWASDGWCQRCSSFMQENCKKSCGACSTATRPPATSRPQTPSPDCKDHNQYCGSWASSGECRRNAAYMLVYCKLSCGQC